MSLQEFFNEATGAAVRAAHDLGAFDIERVFCLLLDFAGAPDRYARAEALTAEAMQAKPQPRGHRQAQAQAEGAAEEAATKWARKLERTKAGRRKLAALRGAAAILKGIGDSTPKADPRDAAELIQYAAEGEVGEALAVIWFGVSFPKDQNEWTT